MKMCVILKVYKGFLLCDIFYKEKYIYTLGPTTLTIKKKKKKRKKFISKILPYLTWANAPLVKVILEQFKHLFPTK